MMHVIAISHTLNIHIYLNSDRNLPFHGNEIQFIIIFSEYIICIRMATKRKFCKILLFQKEDLEVFDFHNGK